MSIICGIGRSLNKVESGDGREGIFRREERSYIVNYGKNWIKVTVDSGSDRI
jgi:hypothetical protein